MTDCNALLVTHIVLNEHFVFALLRGCWLILRIYIDRTMEIIVKVGEDQDQLSIY
jgi:hypothetical protein